MADSIVEVQDLHTWFTTPAGAVKAVNGVDLSLVAGQRLAILGESGCGKSVLTQTLFRLLPPTAQFAGKIRIFGHDVHNLSDRDMARLRGKTIGLIPQHISSLNPLLRIRTHIAEAIAPKSRRATHVRLRRTINERLQNVSLPPSVAGRLPHELSGGMNRRVLIAMGTAQSPPLLVADEPTSGLDRVLRARIVELLNELTADKTLLMITHDIDVARFCDTVAVMYAGRIIEQGPTASVLGNPQHPYTRGLMASQPSRGLQPILGTSPSLINIPSGCAFHPRCAFAEENCSTDVPQLTINGVEQHDFAATPHVSRCLLVQQRASQPATKEFSGTVGGSRA